MGAWIVTLTLAVPLGVRVTFALAGVTVRPIDENPMETVPLKPFRLSRMMVEVPVVPR